MANKINWQEHSNLNKSKSLRWQRLGGWIGHIVKFIFCLAFVVITFYYLVWPQIQVNYLFKSTDCLILSKQLEPTSKFIKNSGVRARFLAFYEVNHQVYQNWGTDALNSIYTNPAAYSTVANQFKIGDYYKCWYDPANPHRIILKRGWDHMSLIFFLMTLIVVLTSITSFCRWYRQRGE